jgi:predicted nucleic acid-binding Zn finger protein
VVKGSNGNTYTIEDGKCSCPGFTYRGNCKHVKENS